jgi:LysR family hydrogen peroxide-inducible transcriptional activator
MISLQQMRYLVILSEELQFSRASERCFVTQPTLSMQVKKAEEQLGYRVFDRATTPLSLTPYGQEIIPILRSILAENDTLRFINERMAGKIKEEIRVGIIPTVSVYMLTRLFSMFAEALSNVRLVYLEHPTEVLIQELEKGTLDLGILAGPFQQVKYRTAPLFTEEIEVYTALGDERSLDVLSLDGQQPWLLSKGNCLRTQVINFCNISETAVGPTWDYIGGNMDLLVEMVNMNGGYTLLPAAFKSAKENPEFRKRLVSPYGSPAREIIGVFPQRSYKTPHLERIVKEIQLVFSQRSDVPLHILDWK